MNAQELLVSKGDLAVAVVGREEDFRLIRLDGDLDAAIAEARTEGCNGYFFAGVFAVVNGQAIANCEPGLNAHRVMLAAVFEYARQVTDRLKQQHAGDAVEWLNRLHSIEDPR